MFSNLEDFQKFVDTLTPVLIDTFVAKPTREGVDNGHYFVQSGLWPGTENQLYIYDRKKLESHKSTLLSLCKALPRFKKSTSEHAGLISSFDLLLDANIRSKQTPEEIYSQLAVSNHFANFLCGSGIANVTTVSKGPNKAFLIVLDKKYRSYFEKEGKEPYED